MDSYHTPLPNSLFRVLTFVAWNWLQWVYLHHGNKQLPQTRLFFFPRRTAYSTFTSTPLAQTLLFYGIGFSQNCAEFLLQTLLPVLCEQNFLLKHNLLPFLNLFFPPPCSPDEPIHLILSVLLSQCTRNPPTFLHPHSLSCSRFFWPPQNYTTAIIF